MKKKIKRRHHQYKVKDLIQIKNYSKTKYGQAEYVGPYPVTRVNDNGTLRYRNGITTDVVNIRNAVPYHE